MNAQPLSCIFCFTIVITQDLRNSDHFSRVEDVSFACKIRKIGRVVRFCLPYSPVTWYNSHRMAIIARQSLKGTSCPFQLVALWYNQFIEE